MKIVLTGATGFVGESLLKSFLNSGLQATTISRSKITSLSCTQVIIAEPALMKFEDFPDGDIFIHLGGLSDANMKLSGSDFNLVNRDWTLRMAEFAASKDYSKFIFLSSAKVHGDFNDEALNSDSPFNPNGYYAESKCEAEDRLWKLDSNMTMAVLRPPAIYGLPLKGGNKRIVTAIRNNKLIPISKSPNKRSFIDVFNVVSALKKCVFSDMTSKNAYALHEKQVISTSRYIQNTSLALGIESRIYQMPTTILSAIDHIAGISIKKHPFAALYRNFYFDCDKFEQHFDWQPLHDTDAGIHKMYERYRPS